MSDPVTADTIAVIAQNGDVVLLLPNGLIWPLAITALLGAYLMVHEAVDMVRDLARKIKRTLS